MKGCPAIYLNCLLELLRGVEVPTWICLAAWPARTARPIRPRGQMRSATRL